MRRILTTLFAILAFIFSSLSAKAEIKILDLGFDNSDGIIQIKSQGELCKKNLAPDAINTDTTITKGALSNPERVYFDITNATLTTPSKNWSLKSSMLDGVKISQFSVNPNIVRITINHSGAKPKDFEVFTNNEQIILKYNGYNKKIVQNSEYSSFYKNTGSSGIVFENTAAILENPPAPARPDGLIPVSNITSSAPSAFYDKQYQMNSRYYINSVNAAQKGVLVGGLGSVSAKPPIYLSGPERMVVDIENAVVAPALRNKSFNFDASDQGEILRLGQFDKNIARLVVQGDNAKNYRVVISPDLQNIFVAKRQDVVNSKLTTLKSSVLSYIAEKSGGASVLNINFTNPVTLSAFEEGGNFHLDIQNVSDLNQSAFDNLIKNPQFASVKNTKIASDKLRLTFPVEAGTQIDAQITDNAKRIKVYFKVTPKVVLTDTPKADTPKNEPTIQAPPKKDPPKIMSYYKVVIDPGHGGSDVGAMRENIFEKDITLEVSNLLVKKLNDQKVFTEMTRKTDKTVDLSERSDFSNKIEPDIFVSVHVNSSTKEDITGVETHWWREDSTELARRIQAQLTGAKGLQSWNLKDRGLFKSQFYVINHTVAPAVLVEIGFISNVSERTKLIDKKYQEDVAQAIADGIMDYLKSGAGGKGVKGGK